MLLYRTVSQIVRLYVLPEVERRLVAGAVRKNDLPFELKQFRVVWPQHQSSPVSVELNDEVKLIAKAKMKRQVAAGESLTLRDIAPEEVFLQAPIVNGKPAAYFFCQAANFDYLLFFDFESNLPDVYRDEMPDAGIKYPVLDLVNAKRFADTVKPEKKFASLAKHNWPPAPGYHPAALMYLHKNPRSVRGRQFAKVVAGSFSQSFWDNRLSFWRETNFFPNRLQYLERAVRAHFENDFICSINVLVPQFEGIIKDYLAQNNPPCPGGFRDCVKSLGDLVRSRKVMMFSTYLLNITLSYLGDGSFWKRTSQIGDATKEVNRHGIAHGLFTDFESEELSLKYLILLDAMSYILLHDRILSGNL